jgi:hypothetical protein
MILCDVIAHDAHLYNLRRTEQIFMKFGMDIISLEVTSDS